METKPIERDDGTLRFQVNLPPELAKKFLTDCENEERPMAENARYIIKMHFRRLDELKKFEEFKKRSGADGEFPRYRAAQELTDLPETGERG